MKVEQRESPMIRVRIVCLESIGPAEDTLSDHFINSNQDLMYRLTISRAIQASKAETNAEAEL
jgi:hypothetical protein